MSGAEALALATGVMTVISFSLETSKYCKAIYDGRQPGDVALRDRALSLNDAIAKLSLHYQSYVPATGDQRLLVEIAGKCNRVAAEIHKVASYSQTAQAQGNWLRSLKLTVKRPSKSRLESLERSLQKYESTLQTQLLVRVCTKSDAVAMQQSESFQSLDQTIKLFVTQFAAQNENAVATLSQTIRTEHQASRRDANQQMRAAEASIKAHIDSGFDDSTQQVGTKSQRERLLRSLKFTGMNERRNHGQITAHQDTFHWVLDADQVSKYDEGDASDPKIR